MIYDGHSPLDFVEEEPIDPNQEEIESVEEPDLENPQLKQPQEESIDSSELSGCIWPILLFIGIGVLVYFLWPGVAKSPKKDKKGPVKELTISEWHDLQMEIVMLRSEVAEVKAINKTPIPISLYRFEQKSGNTDATITLRNNTPKTITMVTGRIFYYSMNGKIIDYKDFSQELSIEPGMAKSFAWNGRYMGEGHYYKNCPDNTAEDHKYKVKLKILQYVTK